jgi:hypothetical protein
LFPQLVTPISRALHKHPEEASTTYGVVKFGKMPTTVTAGATVGPLWNVNIGSAQLAGLTMQFQKVSVVAADLSSDVVHVAGVTDGYYPRLGKPDSGMLSVPFYQLFAENGTVARRMDSAMYTPHGVEVTGMAFDRTRVVIYCGVCRIEHNSREMIQHKAVVGSAGPQHISSRSTDEEPISVAAEAYSAVQSAVGNEELTG